MEEMLIYALVVAAIVAAVWSLFGRGGERYVFKSERESGWENLPGVFKMVWGVATAYENPVGSTLGEWMQARVRKLGELIPASALPLTPERVLSASAFLGMIFGFLGLVAAAMVWAVTPNLTVAIPIGVFLFLFWIGWFWPTQNLKAYVEHRQEELTRQLPFAIDLISSAMRSGLEFGAALRYYVGIGIGGPLQEEFSRVLADVSLGKPFAESLKAMDARVQIDAFSSFVGAVAYGAEVGAPIAGTLKIHGAELRRARFALAERKAARAPVTMILPLVLFIMPSVFIVVLTPLVMRLMSVH